MSQLFSGKDNVSMQTARYQRIGNIPKACPYMQFCTLAYCGGHKSSHLPIKRGLGYLYLRFRISDY